MDRLELLNFIRAKFDDNELHDLCFALNIDYDSLSGDNKAAKARELVALCERRERLPELERVAQRLATAGHSPTARPGASVFNQSEQVVLGDQINVAGDYVDHSTRREVRTGRRAPAAPPVPAETQPRPALDLAAGVVAICAANGNIVGTGFVAAADLIVTCAHVVEQAGGGPDETMSVRFHVTGAQQPAQVLTQYWRDAGAEDLAVLRLTGTLPVGVVPLPLGKASGSDKHAFRSLGYPEVGDYVGLVADGTINAVIRKADGRQMIQLTSSQLAQGHSGAPVWDEAQGCVIGMVSEVYHAGQDNKNRDTAFATPIETLWQVCPTLRAPYDGADVKRENPFYTNGRINDPAQFFGRERLVREICDELSKRNSVSLVGPSQIGKSSLLYYLYTTRTAWLPAVPVEYLDLQRVLDEADFCETLLKKLGVEGNTLRQVKQTLEMREVILLLDEVERIAEPDFNTRLHDLLRSLAQESTFAMCLVTQRPLEEVFPPRLAGGVSPFHNVFTRKSIGPFSEAEGRRFLTSRLAPTSVTFSEREIERLLRDSKCQPAELQRLAKALFDEKIES